MLVIEFQTCSTDVGGLGFEMIVWCQECEETKIRVNRRKVMLMKLIELFSQCD